MLFIYCLFILYILCIGFELGVGFEFSYSKSNILLKDKYINNCLENLFIKENEVNKIKIVNNKQINMFIDILKIYIENENINCKNINYYQFFKNDCYINENMNEKKNKIKQNIFVNDFMIDYGRTLSQYEKEKILEINKISKKNIIFHVHDYDNLILKDNEFINNFEMLEFPKIDKRLLNSYLLNMIGYYQYNNVLLLINWKNYDIDKLSIKELENLMFDLHNSIIMNNKNKKYSSINLCKNILNKKFKKLNLKNIMTNN
jgi:hypothetical protein